MKITFLHEYEKNLVESGKKQVAQKMKEKNYSPEEIYKLTGVKIN